MATRLEKLNARRTDPDVFVLKALNEAYRSISQSESVKYIIGAMQPIEAEYTAATFAEAERVKNQLLDRLSISCSFDFQGSVTNDTHIKAKSDVDLLTVIDRFVVLERPQVPTYPYTGDRVQDLIDLRTGSERALREAFPKATVDATGAKAIAIDGGSLRRKVDVVVCNWFDTNKYAETGSKVFRAIEVLDKNKREVVRNTPFLHNALLDIKDRESNGGFRKATRLMKSVKYDAERVDLSSYDIAALAYNIGSSQLNVPKHMELTLLDVCLAFCETVETNATVRNSLYVPDGHRPVFTEGGATVAGLSQLVKELRALASDVLVENKRSFTKLAEARVAY